MKKEEMGGMVWKRRCKINWEKGNPKIKRQPS